MSIANNPLLNFSGLPRFDEIRPEHVTPAISELLEQGRAAVAHAESPDTPATWDSLVGGLEAACERLGRAWGIIGHLNSVADTPELRAVYGENLPAVTEFWSDLGQNLALYRKYKALAESTEYATLTPARKRVIDNELRGFRLGGAELGDELKPRFGAIKEREAELSKAFSDHVLDATNGWSLLVTDPVQLTGLPEDALAAARAAAERDGEAGWKFTLHFPSYFPVIQYADDRALRERMYRANITRASELGPQYGDGRDEWDNTANMVEQLKLRREQAQLLGHANFGELSLVPKMADSPDQVMQFLDEMARRAKPFAERDLAELQAFAKTECGLDALEPWDIPWVSEKLRVARYAFSEHEVKQYLPEPRVLQGLFTTVEKLFSVRILPDQAPTWHPDVRFYRVETPDGQLRAQFYLDLYAREGKRGGAWMDDARTRKCLADGTIQTPVAYLTCNFSAPTGDTPATFTHDDVITLFHEFGHGLHHMLTEIDELGVSGINGVEWDAVELPSQFMENFCWEWEVLSSMTAHVETGESLPRPLFDKMVAAKNFQNGLATLRQVVFAAFDMELHTHFDPEGAESVLAASRRINTHYHVLPQVSFSRWPNTFSHIFAGGYAAGYYSYKWAEVLSADAYEAFEEVALSTRSTVDPATGSRYLREILQSGGSRPAMDSFKAFRGREPRIDALLRHGGLTQKTA